MNGEDLPSDVPPAPYGRYRVLRLLAPGTHGPVFRGIDPDTAGVVAIKVFRARLTAEQARAVAQGLDEIARRLPAHEALVPVIEAGLAGDEPYLVTELAPGEPLDAALTRYGPALVADVVPRLRILAGAIDAAHASGLCHGALHLRHVMVSADATSLTSVGVAEVLEAAGVSSTTGADAADGALPRALARRDLPALAAIAYEWLFGQPMPAAGGGDLGDVAGADRAGLKAACDMARAVDGDEPMPTCTAFAEAFAVAAGAPPSPSPPKSGGSVKRRSRRVVLRPPADPDAVAPLVVALAEVAGDGQSEAHFPAETPEPAADTPPPRDSEGPPPGWQPSPARVPLGGRQFGLGVVFASVLAGVGLGFVAGYAVRRPAVSMTPAATVAAPAPEAPVVAAPASAEPAGERPAAAMPPAPPVEPSPAAAAAAPATSPGRVLVRSAPAGAAVTVDGVARGETPVAVRDLALGSRTIAVASPGYATVSRRVVLTAGRPSQTLDVRLTPRAARGATRAPARPAPPQAPATGALMVESRPPGALVTLDGQARGRTPLSLDAVAAGPHRLTLELSGYRTFATTVQVAPGARARAAASLERAQEQE